MPRALHKALTFTAIAVKVKSRGTNKQEGSDGMAMQSLGELELVVSLTMIYLLLQIFYYTFDKSNVAIFTLNIFIVEFCNLL